MIPFQPLYYADRVSIVNPYGDVGLVTLWSPVRATRRVLQRLSVGLLDPEKSRICVIANLYGDGLHQMLCNLLFNPQIRHVVAVGEEMNLPTVRELEAFIEHGVEETTMLGTSVLRVPGTERILPALPGFDADRLRSRLTFRYLGRIGELTPEFGSSLDSLPLHGDAGLERLRVEIPADGEYAHRPSDTRSHQISRRSPLDAWKELVTRTVRFGDPVKIRDGERIELLNARVVITEPADDDPAELRRHGFDLARFHDYQKTMLDGASPPGDVTYTYGNRLRGYFPRAEGDTDALRTAATLLRNDPQTRRAYVSLWDTSSDLSTRDSGRDAATPCLVAVFFRRSGDRLTMTATYRSHNLLSAWLQNVYGLMAIQHWVADAAGMTPGPLTVISHQVGIDPRSPRYELAKAVATSWNRDEDVDPDSGKAVLREDPNGYFVVSVDKEANEVVADHKINGLTIKRYRHRSAGVIARQVSADMAVSLVSHALWLGQELATKQAELAADGP